jgi:hypothetical protein
MHSFPPQRTFTSAEVVDRFLQHISVGNQFLTPDFHRGRVFTVAEIGPTSYFVRTQSEQTLLEINFDNVRIAYQFLLDSTVGPNNPIAIRSSDDPDNSGPLCLATRQGPRRVINYILPVLADMGLVGLNGQTQPNTVWLAPRNRVAPTLDEYQL